MVCLTQSLNAQPYLDYVGAGQSQGVSTESSPSALPTNPLNTMDGKGLLSDEELAARFLNYASLGADYETIQSVANQGISQWIDGQFNLAPQVNFLDKTWEIWANSIPGQRFCRGLFPRKRK